MSIQEQYRNYRYETEHFVLRQVAKEDAPGLMKCYGDPAAVALMNDDNCFRGFYCPALEDLETYISIWQSEDYARPVVLDKSTGEAVGTLEIFGGETGVLRVDLRADYEREDVLRELYQLAVGAFMRDYPMGAMVTKAPPAAGARRRVLAELGFAGPGDFRDHPDYYRMPAGKMRRELGIAYCGLACCLCSENKDCAGCRDEGCGNHGECVHYRCCREKGLEGCWACKDFPCDAPMLQKVRVRAFGRFAREYGTETLLDCLEANERAGVAYHRDGLVGDYDLPAEKDIFDLLLKRKG